MSSGVHSFVKELLLTFNELWYQFRQVFFERLERFCNCLGDVNNCVAGYLEPFAYEAVCFPQQFFGQEEPYMITFNVDGWTVLPDPVKPCADGRPSMLTSGGHAPGRS